MTPTTLKHLTTYLSSNMKKNYTLYNGNCLDVLKTLPDNSVDSIVTDPPYGLAFMGKKWDYDVPSQEIWEEALRVLKPGGYLLAFAGTRTQHRMAVRIEDAGFEIRDMIAWVYGCLSEDTQIVTPNGNKPYTTIKPGDLVLCYDKYNKEYSYQPVEEVYEYDIKDTAYRIQSDHTDQIVSRNHRCLVERNGREVFLFAEELETQENIPFLEDLRSLQSAISDSYKRTSVQKQNVFRALLETTDWIEKLWNPTIGKPFWYCTSSLFGLWSGILSQQKTFGASGNASMFIPMQWSFAWRSMETTCSSGSEELDARIGRSTGEKNDGGYQSKLEGWNNLQKTKRKSQGSEVYSLPEGILGYGAERWLHNGASVSGSAKDRKIADTNRSSAPYQSQPVRQPNRESDVVCNQSGTQTIREWSGHKTTLATVTPFEYEGKIWCVKVPTGSFVAFRNGKAFTTGNSGFPKSMDVSKAIDKAAGADRTVKRGVKPGHEDFADRSTKGHLSGENKNEGWTRPWMEAENANDYHYEFEPATDEAKQWEGWGTALKPALEPITVARKPLEEKTVAANVLKYGTGGINIDASRISTNPDVDDPRLGGNGTWKTGNMAKNVYEGGYSGEEVTSSAKGRFPANFIHDGSEEVISLFPTTKAGGSVSGKEPSRTGDENTNCYGEYGRVSWDSYNDNGSAARFFYCAKTSKKDRNEGLENFKEKSVGGKGNGIRRVCSKCGASSLEAHTCLCEEKDWINPPTKKNHHPTVKPTDLMRYLVRMVTPKGGTVLDPFMGSGSTGKAAMLEQFKFVGIELDPEFIDIAKARIEFANPEDEVFDEVVKTDVKEVDNLFEF